MSDQDRISPYNINTISIRQINFQTGKAILLPVEFQEFQAILNGNKR